MIIITNKMLYGKMLMYLFNISEAEKKDDRMTNANDNLI